MLNKLDELLLGSLYLKQSKYWVNKLANITKTHLGDYLNIHHVNGTKIVEFQLSEELSKQVVDLSKNSDLLTYIILLTGLKGLLYRYLNCENISIISPVYKPFISDKTLNSNVLINNNIVGSDSFKDLLKQNKNTVIEAYENQDYPFDKILNSNKLSSDISDISCLLSSIHKEEQSDTFKTNLVFKYTVSNDRIFLKLEYNDSIYRQKRIELIITHLNIFLINALKNIETPIHEIEIISNEEKQQLLIEFNNTRIDYSKDKTIHQLFEDQVLINPDRIAIVANKQEITYDQLNKTTNKLSHFLIKKGIGVESIVGIELDSSYEFVVCMLAILKACGAYLPIDVNLPKYRKQYIVKNSRLKTLIHNNNNSNKLYPDIELIHIEELDIEKYHDSNPNIQVRSSNLAYIIYTSGTTGNPKGTLLEHKGIVSENKFWKNDLQIEKEDKCMQYASISFDASVWEICLCLLNGASLYIPDISIKIDKSLFEEYLIENGITVLTLPPIFARGLDDASFTNVKLLITAGSETDERLIKKFNKNTRYINAYGPTETSVCATYWDTSEYDKTGQVSIGCPICNLQAYILDSHLKLVGIGIPGELCISGDGLARGYLWLPELTDQKFIDHPFKKGEKLYRTGDIARWFSNGNIEFLGRIDNQVKIRGFRIELGEVENKLLEIEQIKEVVVIDRLDKDADKYLCAYVVCNNNYKLSLEISAIRNRLSESLPDYMIPSYFVELDTIPLTSNGKIDRKQLPEPKLTRNDNYIAPKSEIEKTLVSIWAEVLDIETDKIGVNDNFFDMGGNSIKILKLTYSINQAFNCNITVAQMFDKNRITDLVKFINLGKEYSMITIEKEVDELIQDRNEFLNMESLLG